MMGVAEGATNLMWLDLYDVGCLLILLPKSLRTGMKSIHEVSLS